MILKLPFTPIALATIIGLAHTWASVWCWVYIPQFHQIPSLLLSLGLRGTPYYALVGLHDLLINIVLAAPAAYALCILRPRRLAIYFAAAVAPSFIWLNWLIFSGEGAISPSLGLLQGWATQLLSVPVAAWLILRIGAPGTPDQSFKRTGAQHPAPRP